MESVIQGVNEYYSRNLAREEHAIIAATYTIPITALQETAEKEAAEAKEYQKNILKLKF